MTLDPFATLRPLEARSSLREQVKEALEAALVAGEMRPGVVFSAPVLAQSFGVSVTPVREALLDLAKEGLVEPVRNKGFRVTTLSETDLDEIYELRLLLEVPAVRRLAGVLGVEAQQELREQAGEIETAAVTGNLIEYIDADRRFHKTLLSHTGNARLVAVVGNLRSQARLFGLAELAHGGQLVASAQEHQSLLVAIASGDAATAEQLMREHLRHTRGIWAGHHDEVSTVTGA